MGKIGQIERITQNRIVDLFKDKNKLDYEYLGDRAGLDNKNIEEDKLISFLKRQCYSEILIDKAIKKLQDNARIIAPKKLYDANKDVYNLLRYGVKVKETAHENTQTVWLIDWRNPKNNDFYIAEEVTVKEKSANKRPDIVFYINGIAIGVLELKRSVVTVGEGIRQNLTNQSADQIPNFFTTIQLVMASNDTEGLRYGAIETIQKYYLEWKEEGGIGENKLDKHLSLMFDKSRLIDIIHNFIVYDKGVKKLCRHNQFFGIQEARKFVNRHEGGILWHTQGSGKSLTMVWLSKWILENVQDSRVLVVTDRVELDSQIQDVFTDVNESIYRTKSGADLINILNEKKESLICSLVHKFGGSSRDYELSDDDVERYLQELEASKMSNFEAKGDIFVFVDECHRTQSGKLHDAMKKLLPNSTIIGFTGTPLLKKDKKTSAEVFGQLIHSYKFNEATEDGVVLDLKYEPRDIDQYLSSPDKVDKLFEAKTKGLNDYAKQELKKRWATLQKVFSSQARLDVIVQDVIFDMETKPALSDGIGNAILVSNSIYSACQFYEKFQKTSLAGKCAIVTSYNPNSSSINNETTKEGQTEQLFQYDTYRKMLAKFYDVSESEAIKKIEEFEEYVKTKFKKEPAQMKLLIVVDKLLTGFDAPSATYLYIDKKMQDHGLFQAICRVNRLNGEEKDFGYIIDYKDLFNSLESTLHDYSFLGGAFEGYDVDDISGLLVDRVKDGRDNLEAKLELIRAHCGGVKAPKDTNAYMEYFCAKGGSLEDQDEAENRRRELYKFVSSLIRAYINIANDMHEAGYSIKEAEEIKQEVNFYDNLRKEVKMFTGDHIDMKQYEPAMRRLIDSYIKAEESEVLADLGDLSLLDIVLRNVENSEDKLPKGWKKNDIASEGIEKNLSRLIVDERAANPAYYDKMSELLEIIIEDRKNKVIEYKEYLKRIASLIKKVKSTSYSGDYPVKIKTSGQRALYDFLSKNEDAALFLDKEIRVNKKDGFRGNNIKERALKKVIFDTLISLGLSYDVNKIFEIVKNDKNGY